MDNILEVKNVSKAFTGHVALDNVSLAVPRGCVYGLLGPNGAGKTTLIRIVNHITAPDNGQVLFDGEPLTAAHVPMMGYLPEERGLYKKMKVGEQALFFARLKGLDKARAEKALHEWFDRLEISSWWHRKVEELSKGMAQKVQFIVTVLHNPRLLIFDEPFSGFDPINAGVLKREILRLRDQGATVIFSTHNMASVEELCDEITLINASHNILTGNVAELRRSYSDQRYELGYTGDGAVLAQALQPKVRVLDPAGTDRDGISHMRFSLADGVSSNDILATAAPVCNISSFNPLLPSMDDIFVSAVTASNNAGAPVPPPVDTIATTTQASGNE